MSVTRASFDGSPFPSDVVAEIISKGLTGAPVFDSLTRRTTDRGSVVFPTGDPDGFDWVQELGEIPAVDPGDDSAPYAVTKIAGRILLSNESIGDTEMNVTDEVGRLIAESMAPKADKDLVYGVTPAAPEAPGGVFGSLTEVAEATLRDTVIQAAADIMAAGGTPTTVLLSPALWAAEVKAMGAGGADLFGDLGLPLTVVVAHTLNATDGLILDRAGAFGIVRTDYSIEASAMAGDAWARDGVSLRVKARLAMAIPAPSKHARALAIEPATEA